MYFKVSFMYSLINILMRLKWQQRSKSPTIYTHLFPPILVAYDFS